MSLKSHFIQIFCSFLYCIWLSIDMYKIHHFEKCLVSWTMVPHVPSKVQCIFELSSEIHYKPTTLLPIIPTSKHRICTLSAQFLPVATWLLLQSPGLTRITHHFLMKIIMEKNLKKKNILLSISFKFSYKRGLVILRFCFRTLTAFSIFKMTKNFRLHFL